MVATQTGGVAESSFHTPPPLTPSLSPPRSEGELQQLRADLETQVRTHDETAAALRKKHTTLVRNRLPG